mgnify:CR=1 FL=1
MSDAPAGDGDSAVGNDGRGSVTAGRFVGNLTLFAIFFVATAVVSQYAFPFPPDGFVARRLQFVESARPSFNVVFLGSSVTLRGVDPIQFDADVARKCGGQIRSANLGVKGADGSIIDTLLDELTARLPDSIRWVVFETRAWDDQVEPLAESNWRAIWSHSPSNTLGWVLDTWALPEPLSIRLALINDHLMHLIARTLRIGRGIKIVQSWYEGTAPIELPDRGAELFMSGWTASAGERERRERLVRDFSSFDRRVEKLAATSRHDTKLSLRERSRFQQRLGTVREASLGSLHFMVPNANERARSLRAKSGSLRELVPDLVMLDDPGSHPYFFAHENRWDRTHLNARGAAFLTTELAEAFCEQFGSDLP